MSYCLHGTGSAVGLVPTVYATVSKVDVFSVDGSWLVTARPKLVSSNAEGNVEEPTGVQSRPSEEMVPVTVSPVRARRSHTGTLCVAPPRYVMDPPLLVRAMNSMSP